jgi:stalled ribosome alternative rescue factor ArfA
MSTNPYAKALSHKLFQKRVVKPKKGKGAYNRKAQREIQWTKQ